MPYLEFREGGGGGHLPSHFAGFSPPLGIYKLVGKHTNLDCHPLKILNTQFLSPLNKISE